LKKVIRDSTLQKDEDAALADDSNPICLVFVVATRGRIADGPLKLFRSYGHDRDQTLIWQAARATSAAPAFFPPAKVDIPSPAGWYVDGGVRANNPSWEAISEGKKHWKTRKCFIVSVGTGVQKPVDFIGKMKPSGPSEAVNPASSQCQDPELRMTQTSEPIDGVQQPGSNQRSRSLFGGVAKRLKKAGLKIGGTATTTIQPITDKAAQMTRIPGGIQVAAHIVKALVDLSTSSESMHLRVWEEAHSQDESAQFPYFRFNVLRGMDEIGLEEWRMAEAMGDVTRSYLDTPDVKQALEKCAKGLVEPIALEGT
jgi:hypothetical protein